MKRALFFLIAILLCAAARAVSPFSYLYIQGDKQTPFYVKVEDAMQPRYGKNYCIVSQLAAGETHLEILFQQNAFPPQQFTVLIPEGGSRGFLLVRKEGAFSLYDLQSGAYLPAGNTAAQDVLPSSKSSHPVAAILPQEHSQKAASDEEPAVIEERPKKALKQHGRKEARPSKEPGKKIERPAGSGDPVFINGIELGNNSAARSKPAGEPDVSEPASGLPVITNSDCPAAIRSEEFSTIFQATNTKEGDEDRVDYLSGQMDRCYTSWMARALAMRLQSDAARYSFLKKIFPRITDQASFSLLDDLLTTDIWKAEFAKLIHH